MVWKVDVYVSDLHWKTKAKNAKNTGGMNWDLKMAPLFSNYFDQAILSICLQNHCKTSFVLLFFSTDGCSIFILIEIWKLRKALWRRSAGWPGPANFHPLFGSGISWFCFSNLKQNDENPVFKTYIRKMEYVKFHIKKWVSWVLK